MTKLKRVIYDLGLGSRLLVLHDEQNRAVQRTVGLQEATVNDYWKGMLTIWQLMHGEKAEL